MFFSKDFEDASQQIDTTSALEGLDDVIPEDSGFTKTQERCYQTESEMKKVFRSFGTQKYCSQKVRLKPPEKSQVYIITSTDNST